MGHMALFKVCNTLDEVREVFEKRERDPLYCLKENCVEGYLFPNFDCSNSPENYKKRKMDRKLQKN